MLGIARGQPGGVCGHVINRGNARQTVFHDEDDYTVFVELIGLACERIPRRRAKEWNLESTLRPQRKAEK